LPKSAEQEANMQTKLVRETRAMNRTSIKRIATAVVTAALCIGTAAAQSPDPGKDFFGNFISRLYYMPIYPLDGQQFGGDLTALYDQAYIVNRANRELLIVGEYPRARFFSITLYDDHGAVIATLHDTQINPLSPGKHLNPYRIGGPAGAEDILYAVRVRLGDGHDAGGRMWLSRWS
jgi:hypothetical protein